MNDIYFTNPTLSKKLQALGMVSQFDEAVYGIDNGVAVIHMTDSDYEVCSCEDINLGLGNSLSFDERHQKTYHFSDLLLPDNAKKLWSLEIVDENDGSMLPEYINKTQWLLMMIQMPPENVTWQSWLNEEVSKKPGYEWSTGKL